MEALLSYIRETYAPLSLIVYGSYADGTHDTGSDFDALVITEGRGPLHDTSCVGGVTLDVFVYPASYFDKEYNPKDFIQIVGGKILIDADERAEKLQKQVAAWLESRPDRSAAHIRSDIDWCIKMLGRVERGDAEGYFRWHWLLYDSLSIFCDVQGQLFLGPKKTLARMAQQHPVSAALYERALREFTPERLKDWISHLASLMEA
jgi:predicted nucleotidyltransferase